MFQGCAVDQAALCGLQWWENSRFPRGNLPEIGWDKVALAPRCSLRSYCHDIYCSSMSQSNECCTRVSRIWHRGVTSGSSRSSKNGWQVKFVKKKCSKVTQDILDILLFRAASTRAWRGESTIWDLSSAPPQFAECWATRTVPSAWTSMPPATTCSPVSHTMVASDKWVSKRPY